MHSMRSLRSRMRKCIEYGHTGPRTEMDTSQLVYIINIVSLIVSVAQLCVASSIFDFIVLNGLYYTANNDHAIMFFTAPLMSAVIAFLTIAVPTMPRRLQNFISRHPFLIAAMHVFTLTVSTLVFAFCSLAAAQLSQKIGYYASDGIPQKIQSASSWYFMRLEICTVMLGLQSILTLSQTALLYMRKDCRYKMHDTQQKGTTEFAYTPLHS
ncbi:hypothetical protein PENTCL1PPCAC_14082 [Pristionchus entomophagus]|uniref:G protein-coupled receptor n=1 Tax=Pristionchus entomophagus TaxID=358040 RepID=A0AAV5TC48_9BILA|nr:hypothetical protein PENTCL1PPCAC_14082 [Pristionchus entomophagus]